MQVVEFTFEDGSKYSFPPEEPQDHTVEGSWEAPPIGQHAAFVAEFVERFVDTDIGVSLIHECGDITAVSVRLLDFVGV